MDTKTEKNTTLGQKKLFKRIQLKTKPKIICIGCKSDSVILEKTFYATFVGIFFKTLWYKCSDCGRLFPVKIEVLKKPNH